MKLKEQPPCFFGCPLSSIFSQFNDFTILKKMPSKSATLPELQNAA